MAVVAAPIAAVGIGGVYFIALSKTLNSTANLSAKQAFGVDNAYPWPFWSSWFSQQVESNSTLTGNVAALALAGVAFGVQKRFIWRHVGNSLRVPVEEQVEKIRNISQFVKIVGPGIMENSANALATCGIVGLAKPWLDGGNNLHSALQAARSTS